MCALVPIRFALPKAFGFQKVWMLEWQISIVVLQYFILRQKRIYPKISKKPLQFSESLICIFVYTFVQHFWMVSHCCVFFKLKWTRINFFGECLDSFIRYFEIIKTITISRLEIMTLEKNILLLITHKLSMVWDFC